MERDKAITELQRATADLKDVMLEKDLWKSRAEAGEIRCRQMLSMGAVDLESGHRMSTVQGEPVHS